MPGGPADRVQPRVRRPGYRASPNFMGLTSFGLEIGIFCDFRYSVLLLNAILGLDFLGRALSRPQVLGLPLGFEPCISALAQPNLPNATRAYDELLRRLYEQRRRTNFAVVLAPRQLSGCVRPKVRKTPSWPRI